MTWYSSYSATQPVCTFFLPSNKVLSLGVGLTVLSLIHVLVIHWSGQLVEPTVSKVVENQKEKGLAAPQVNTSHFIKHRIVYVLV